MSSKSSAALALTLAAAALSSAASALLLLEAALFLAMRRLMTPNTVETASAAIDTISATWAAENQECPAALAGRASRTIRRGSILMLRLSGQGRTAR